MQKEVIENKANPFLECEKVLGGLDGVYAIADFWEHHAKEIQLIATNELILYTENENFDSKEIAAFKQGLAKIPVFMQKCWEERQKVEA